MNTVVFHRYTHLTNNTHNCFYVPFQATNFNSYNTATAKNILKDLHRVVITPLKKCTLHSKSQNGRRVPEQTINKNLHPWNQHSNKNMPYYIELRVIL